MIAANMVIYILLAVGVAVAAVGFTIAAATGGWEYVAAPGKAGQIVFTQDIGRGGGTVIATVEPAGKVVCATNVTIDGGEVAVLQEPSRGRRLTAIFLWTFAPVAAGFSVFAVMLRRRQGEEWGTVTTNPHDLPPEGGCAMMRVFGSPPPTRSHP